MILVGGGSLVARAIRYCERENLAIDLVCCRRGDVSAPRFRNSGAIVLETDDPNTDLLPLLRTCKDGVAFSINNSHILGDTLLAAGVSFFNVHNGLVQQYRGRGEVCVFAGICKGEQRYGVTLHRIVENQKVDSGPVIAQLAFEVAGDDTFSDLMSRSLDACQRIFECNVKRILENNYIVEDVETVGPVYSYKDVSRLCVEAGSDRLSRASNFGPYEHFFPKLKSIVDSAR